MFHRGPKKRDRDGLLEIIRLGMNWFTPHSLAATIAHGFAASIGEIPNLGSGGMGGGVTASHSALHSPPVGQSIPLREHPTTHLRQTTRSIGSA
jgi:hypothetical protein